MILVCSLADFPMKICDLHVKKKKKETNIYSTYDCVNQDISYHLIDKTIFWININKVVLRKSQKV